MSKFVLASFGKQPLTGPIVNLVEISVGDLVLFAYPHSGCARFEDAALAHDVLIREIAQQLAVVPVSFGVVTGSKDDIEDWANSRQKTLQQSYHTLHNVAQMSLFVLSKHETITTPAVNYLRQKADDIGVARAAKEQAYVLASDLVSGGILTAFSVDHSDALEGKIRIDGLMLKDNFAKNRASLANWVHAQQDDIRISGPFLPYRFFSRFVAEANTK